MLPVARLEISAERSSEKNKILINILYQICGRSEKEEFESLEINLDKKIDKTINDYVFKVLMNFLTAAKNNINISLLKIISIFTITVNNQSIKTFTNKNKFDVFEILKKRLVYFLMDATKQEKNSCLKLLYTIEERK